MLRRIFKRFRREYIWLRYGGIKLARLLGVEVGKNCRIYIKNFGTEPYLISIGDNVTIAKGVKILTHDGSTWLLNDQKGRRYLYNKVVIGDNVFIGVNSIIMPGVQIENNVVVGCGSVVTKSIPSDTVVAGNPARKIQSYSEYKTRCIQYYVSDEDFDKCKDAKDNIMILSNKHSPKKFL